MNEEWCVGYEEGKMDALKEIEAAIEAAVLAEREACAKVCVCPKNLRYGKLQNGAPQPSEQGVNSEVYISDTSR